MSAQTDNPVVTNDEEDNSIIFGLDRNDIGAIVVKTIITGVLMTGIKVVQRKIDNHFDAEEAMDAVEKSDKDEATE